MTKSSRISNASASIRGQLWCFSIAICLTVGLITSVASVCSAQHAFPRVEPPIDFPPHPRLYLNSKEADQLQAWAQREPWLRDYVAEFLERVRKTAAKPELPGRSSLDNLRIARLTHEYALAYLLTDDELFARATAAVLKAYIETMPTYKVSYMKGLATSSTIAEAMWASDIASAYDLIHNSGQLTAENKQDIERRVLKPSAEAMRICNHKMRSNWRARAIAGVGVVGFCIGDRDLIDEAVNGYYSDNGKLLRDGFVQHVAWSVLADGVFYERALNYQYFSLDGYTMLLEAARHSGVDLWNLQVGGHRLDAGADMERNFGQTGPKTVRSIFDTPFYQSFGDGSVVRVGNSFVDRTHRMWFFEAAWRAYRDPKYAYAAQTPGKTSERWMSWGTGKIDSITADYEESPPPVAKRINGRLPHQPTELVWMAPNLPAGEFDFSTDSPIGVTGRHTNACSLMPNGGLTVLRQSSQRDAVSVLMTYGDFGSAHTHPDQLAIVVYAAGRQMIPEVRYHYYGEDSFLSWDRQTIAHNTVTVDKVSQYPQGDKEDRWALEVGGKHARSRPLFFHARQHLKAFRATCDAVYEGVVLDRTVALVDSVIIDFYRCRSQREHEYHCALHVDGQQTNASLDIRKRPGESVRRRLGYRHLDNLRRGIGGAEPIRITYVGNDSGPEMRLSFLPNDATELLVAEGHPDRRGQAKDVLIRQHSAANTDFVSTIVFPEQSNVVTTSRLDSLAVGVLGVELTKEDGEKLVVLSAESSDKLAYDGEKYNGQLVLLKVAGDSVTLVDAVK